MVRSAVAQVTQIGLETTAGTAHAATRRLSSMSIMPKLAAEVNEFRAAGNKYVTVTAANMVWSEAKMTGQPTYNEIILPLASAFTKPVSTALASGFSHVFSPVSEGADNPATYTIEKGDPTGTLNAERMTHAMFKSFSLTVARKGLSMDGELIGQDMGDSLTMTAALTSDTQVPILPGQFNVFVSDLQADLGGITGTGSKLGNVLSAKVGIENRFNPAWFLNASAASWTTYVENAEPGFTCEWLCEADAVGRDWLSKLRTGATRFVRLESIGPIIGGAVTYKLMWDFAVKVIDPGDFSDEDGVYAIGPKMAVVHDGGWGRASRVTVQNNVTALT